MPQASRTVSREPAARSSASNSAASASPFAVCPTPAPNKGTLPRSLAIDGKAIGGLKGGIITLCHQATGAPVAMAVHQGAKADCEMPVARELLDSVQPSLDNAVVTADALHCQKKTARTIVERGGDYLIALHDNQPGLRAQARRRLEAAPPLCPPVPKSATDASSSDV